MYLLYSFFLSIDIGKGTNEMKGGKRMKTNWKQRSMLFLNRDPGYKRSFQHSKNNETIMRHGVIKRGNKT